jgi:hypothetical protein
MWEQVKGRTDPTMVEQSRKYWLSHLIVRLVVGLNFAHLLLMYYHPYFRAARNIFHRGGDVYAMMISSLLLPLYVGFETWWMFEAKPSQTRALIIDWAAIVVWFVLLWGIVVYARTHYF